MSYNYGSECRKFQAKWDKLYREYAAEGMSKTAIRALWGLDWQQLKSDRAFYMHTQPLECLFSDDDTAGEDNSPLINRQLEHLSISLPEIRQWGRYDWIEDIDTPALAKAVKASSQADLELLSYLVTDGLSRAEVAKELKVSRAAVTKRLNRIKGRLEKIYCQG